VILLLYRYYRFILYGLLFQLQDWLFFFYAATFMSLVAQWQPK